MQSQTIKWKLILLSGSLMVTIALVGMISFYGNLRLSSLLRSAGSTYLPAVRLMGEIDMYHDGLRGIVYNSIVASTEGTDQERTEMSEEVTAMSSNLGKLMKELLELEISEKSLSLIKLSEPEIENYVKEAQEIVALASKKQTSKALNKISDFKKAFHQLEEKLNKLSSALEDEGMEKKAEGALFSQKMTMLNLVLIIVGLAGGALVSFFVSRSLIRQLEQIVTQLTKTSGGLSHAFQALDSSAAHLASATSTQVSSLQATSSALTEISSMVSSTSSNASLAADSISQSKAKAQEGQMAIQSLLKSVQDFTQTNQKLFDQMSQSNQQLTEISSVIEKIDSKTKVIHEIVFQTKLLSFNASVEAARAGEHGKGFSVVAEEVGNLARMSGGAALEISNLLSESVTRVNDIVSTSEKKVEELLKVARERIQANESVARNCNTILSDLFSNIENIAKLSTEIAAATREQSTGVDEISKAVDQLDSVSLSVREASTSLTASADELKENSQATEDLVKRLVGLIGGASRNSKVENPSPGVSENETQIAS